MTEELRNEITELRNEVRALDEGIRTLTEIVVSALDAADELAPEGSDDALGELLERKHAELAQRVKASRRGH